MKSLSVITLSLITGNDSSLSIKVDVSGNRVTEDIHEKCDNF